ncbi:hypothetical protein QIH80_35700 [Bradyrhizobium elkanii]|nr:hypothetical protein QIH80_35700 [Bradyrhizobium elkanii]
MANPNTLIQGSGHAQVRARRSGSSVGNPSESDSRNDMQSVSGLGLSLTHQGKLHFIQWHHSFPKSLLKDRQYETGEINEIANMAFITGQTNRRLSNKEPTAYLPGIVAKQGQESLDAQLVPALLKLENYKAFLKARRIALAKCINDFIAKKAGEASK